MRAVILIHGFITGPSDFNPLYKFLYKKYDQVYKVVLPGHNIGENYKTFNVNGSFNVVLNAYDELANEHAIIDVIGFSLGGALATYLASVRKVNKLVLLAPANKYLNFSFIRRYLSHLRQFRIRYKILKRKKDPRAQSYLDKLISIKKNNRASIKLGFTTLFPHYTIKNIKIFRKIIKRVNKSLAPISAKTLLCWGELDQLVPYKSLRFIERYLNDYKEIVYNDLSHLMLSSVNITFLVNNIERFLE